LLRPSNEWHRKSGKNDREPDPLHGAPRGRTAGGSLADYGRSLESAASVSHRSAHLMIAAPDVHVIGRGRRSQTRAGSRSAARPPCS
jgi:hypothetical protein